MGYGSEKIQKLNAELDLFVYSCYHDLRAPVATVLGLINLIKSSSPEDVDNYVNLIHESILKLDMRIKDIIDYSKNSRLKLYREKIDIYKLIETALEGYQQDLKKQSVTATIEVASQIDMYTDKVRLTIILNNLISNAVNFQRVGVDDGWIEIKGEVSMENLILTISDNGIGITQKELDHACEMFYRASSNSIGAGLGLYIVKESLKKLNGNLEISSTTMKGTTVKITIPNLY